MTSSQEPPLTRREIRERERLQAQEAGSATPDATPPAAAPAATPPFAGGPAPARPPQPGPPQPPQQAPAYAAPRPVAAPAPVAPQVSPFAPPAPAAPSFAPPQTGQPVRPAPQGQPAPPHQQAPSAPPNAAPRPTWTPPAAAPQAPGPQVPVGQGAQPGRPVDQAANRGPAGPTRSAGRAPERTLTRRELRSLIDSQHVEGDDDDDFDALLGDASVPASRSSSGAPQGGAPAAPAPGPVRTPAPHQAADAARADEPVAPKPAGHWTDQLNLPDEEPEPFDQLLSRGASSHGVPTTTNALILPTLPDQGSIGATLGSEVIVTGSIDLPRSYGATGLHPSQIDSTDIDRLFDRDDDAATTGVAPVAATKAISTQGGARTMMAPPQKEGVNVPLVLAVTAGVLALGVVATLIIGAMTGLF
ncbi:hypothetical protein ACGGZK_13220 [Agromyces sp. MMS24-K17]|uniref:hypothetical protein n=1 Tax=Agromyces sp. MMS24-K17 TaxID=3372850 RepID=UPI003754D4FB